MGVTKKELFSDQQNQLARLAKAIAHPARIAILEHLIKNGSCVCGDVVKNIPLSQSTVSQHLKAMQDAGIIKSSAEGVYTCYCLDMKSCAELFTRIQALVKNVTNCC